MEKIIFGFIKFYLVYMLFGTLAIIILYASADLKCFIETGESFLRTLIHTPDSISDAEAKAAVLNYMKFAFDSVPGDTFFDATLGVYFDSNIVPDMSTFIDMLFNSKENGLELGEKIANYDLFWRDMSVATSASMVLYAVSHFKKRIVGAGISVWLAFALASVFWIFGAYTFGEIITYSLEQRVNMDNLNVLYIIIIVTAILLEASIHAYGGKCTVHKLAALLFFKLLANLLKMSIAWFMCSSITYVFIDNSIVSAMDMLVRMMGIITSAGIIIGIAFVEEKLTNLAEKAT